MTELETALKQFNEQQALANTNMDDVPMRVRSGRETQKREAAANLEGYRTAYGKALQKSLFVIAVVGEGTDAFSKIAVEEADCLVIDGDEMLKRIIDRIEPSMGSSREFGVSQYSSLIQELRSIGMELEVESMPSPKWSEPMAVGNRGGLLQHVRQMVESGVGLDLQTLYIQKQILAVALKSGSDRNTIPVVVTGLPRQSATALLTKISHDGRNTFVDASIDMNKEFVLEIFNKIKKQLKTNKKSDLTPTK